MEPERPGPILLTIVAAVAIHASGCAALFPPPKPAPPAIEDFIRATLTAAVEDNKIPDVQLLPANGPIPVAADIGLLDSSEVRLTQRSLPGAINGRTFKLVTLDQLQRDANRSGDAVPYVDLHDPDVKGNEAQISIAVRLVLPKSFRGPLLCCCEGRFRLARNGSQWRFVEELEGHCI